MHPHTIMNAAFKNILAYKYEVYKRESSDFSDLIPQLKHVLLEIGDL